MTSRREAVRGSLELRASLLAGLPAGLVALAGFAALHAVLVGPRVGLVLLAAGAVPALLAGALAGWAYHEAGGALPPPRRGPGLGALLWAATVPAGLAGAARAPLAALGVPPGLLVAAALGWLLGRTPRAALAVLLAAALPVLLVASGAAIVGGGARELAVLAAMLPILLGAGSALQAARPHVRATLVRRARAR